MFRLLLPLIGLLASCGNDLKPIEISFAAQYGDHPLDCQADTAPVRLTDLRLYLHDIRLFAADGSELPVSLVVDDQWQNETTVLLDLEDGTGTCLNGSTATNAVVRGHYSGQAATGLAFRIGVPAADNHANPLLAPPPLTYTPMHWHWTTGYKYLRAGVQTPTDGFFMHLGSSRCEPGGAGAVHCASPNRPEFRHVNFAPGEDRVIIDLAMLLQGVDLNDGVSSRCMSGPGESDCVPPLANLGISPDGRPAQPASVFRVANLQ